MVGSETSLSVRRAWIEIVDLGQDCGNVRVALRKESVDRNGQVAADLLRTNMSLSVRRAWIEMLKSVKSMSPMYCRSP